MTNDTAHPQQLATLLLQTRQCAALTSIVRETDGGLAYKSRQAELLGLARDIAGRIYHYLSEVPTSFTKADSQAFGVAGKLLSTLVAICDALERYARADGANLRRDLANHIGWLVNASEDFTQELVGHVEELCAQGGAA